MRVLFSFSIAASLRKPPPTPKETHNKDQMFYLHNVMSVDGTHLKCSTATLITQSWQIIFWVLLKWKFLWFNALWRFLSSITDWIIFYFCHRILIIFFYPIIKITLLADICFPVFFFQHFGLDSVWNKESVDPLCHMIKICLTPHNCLL